MDTLLGTALRLHELELRLAEIYSRRFGRDTDLESQIAWQNAFMEREVRHVMVSHRISEEMFWTMLGRGYVTNLLMRSGKWRLTVELLLYRNFYSWGEPEKFTSRIDWDRLFSLIFNDAETPTDMKIFYLTQLSQRLSMAAQGARPSTPIRYSRIPLVSAVKQAYVGFYEVEARRLEQAARSASNMALLLKSRSMNDEVPGR